MKLEELKIKINTKTLSEKFFLFKYQGDNKFLVKEYIKAIAEYYSREIIYINSINDIQDDSFFLVDNYLYVLDQDKVDNIEPRDFLIVMSENISDNLDFTEFPKLVNWQIEDYIKARVPGLEENQIKFLCEISAYNIYRIDNELKKLELFPPTSQRYLLDEMMQEDAFSDLTTLTIFNFTNAILRKDKKMLCDILSDLKTIDIEGTGVVTLMLKNIKNLIDVQINPKATAESLGMKPNQFNAIRYNKGKFSDNQLINMYEFLTSMDCRIKNGELTLQDVGTHLEINNKLVDYLTINLLTIANN